MEHKVWSNVNHFTAAPEIKHDGHLVTVRRYFTPDEDAQNDTMASVRCLVDGEDFDAFTVELSDADVEDENAAIAAELSSIQPTRQTEHTFLVAFTIEDDEAPTREVAERYLHTILPKPSEHAYLQEWWVAEDDRHDGSDNDSAAFVPGSGLAQSRHLAERRAVESYLQTVESMGPDPELQRRIDEVRGQ